MELFITLTGGLVSIFILTKYILDCVDSRVLASVERFEARLALRLTAIENSASHSKEISVIRLTSIEKRLSDIENVLNKSTLIDYTFRGNKND